MPEQVVPMSGEIHHVPGGSAADSPPTGGADWARLLPTPPTSSLPATASEAPLDLSVGAGRPTSRESTAAMVASDEETVPENCRVMDLSLPDKDSPVEACYTCGTLVRRCTLRPLLVQARHRVGSEPYFPSLLEARRPAGSRPMTPDCRVNVCTCCCERLLAQWQHYQSDDRVPAERRQYSVTSELPPPLEFVCYMCSLAYSVSCLNRVCVTPADAPDSHPEILRPTTPPGAAGVRNGAVSVCSNCRRKLTLQRTLECDRPLPPDSNCYKIIEDQLRAAPAAAPPPVAPEASSSTFHNIRVRRREVTCFLCGGTHQRDFMVEVRFQAGDRSRMHFPALARRTPPPGAVLERTRGLVCVPCYRLLKHQWAEYRARGGGAGDRIRTRKSGSCGSGSDLSRESPPVKPSSPALPEPGSTSHAAASSASSQHLQSSPRRQSSSPVSGLHDNGAPDSFTSKDNSASAKRRSSVDPTLPVRSPKYRRTSGGTQSSSPAPPPTSSSPPCSSPPAPAASAADPLPPPMSLVAPSSVTAGCYACHQPLEANRAYQVRTEPDQASPSAPFFPHLAQQRNLPVPVCSVAVCVYCYHTLADQWARYERLSNKIDPYRREYDTHYFICFVCSIRTYRKRLHIIEVKDFPFLTSSHRYPEGALLICGGTKSVVCRDCHGTLTCQFQDYERWNLPVNKREYNWVTRPPPPESPDSVGARPETVSPAGRWTL